VTTGALARSSWPKRAAVAWSLSFPLLLSGSVMPCVVHAQPAGNVHRIGYLSPGAVASHGPLFKAFLEAMRELGYVEGRNVVVEYRWAEGSSEKLTVLATELVRLKPAVLMTSGTPASLALKEATRQIPVVVLGVGDPVGGGLVASLARPGGNITGLSLNGVEIAGKRVELLRDLVPGVTRVGVLWNPTNAVGALMAREADVAARSLGLQSQSLEVRGPDDFKNAFDVAVKGRVGGIIALEDPLTVVHRKTITGLAAERQLPAIYGLKQFVEAGGLMSYAPSYADIYRRAAVFVDKILRGASPADMPVEEPTKFELAINVKAARILGLKIPPSLLLRADHLIE